MGNDSEFVVSNRTRCQHLRVDPQVSHRPDKCPSKALPGSMWCALHKAEAMLRVAAGRKAQVQ